MVLTKSFPNLLDFRRVIYLVHSVRDRFLNLLKALCIGQVWFVRHSILGMVVKYSVSYVQGRGPVLVLFSHVVYLSILFPRLFGPSRAWYLVYLIG